MTARWRAFAAFFFAACEPAPTPSDGSSSGGTEPTGSTVGADGCGDGVGEPGVWCYERVVIQQDIGQTLAAGDLDGDGRDEIVGWDLVEKNIRVLWLSSDGTPTLGSPIATASLGGAAEILIDDVTGDGLVDVVVATGTTLHTHENLGGGELGEGQPFGQCPGGLGLPTRLLRLDGDSRVDAVVGCGEGVLPLLRVDDGFVELSDPVTTGTCASTAMAIGDLDSDGFDDLLVGGPCAQHMDDVPVAVLLGTGSTLGMPRQYAAGPNGAVDVALGDFDGDSALDAVVGNLEAGQIDFLRGLGDGSLERVGALAIECDATCVGKPFVRRVVAADLDGNGDDELLMVFDGFSPSKGLNWIMNPSPEAAVEVLDPTGGSPTVGDFNADGWPDVIYGIREDEQRSMVLLISNP